MVSLLMTTWNALLGPGVSLLGDSGARLTYSHSRDHGIGGIARSERQGCAFSNALWHRNVPGTPRLGVLQPDLRWLREARSERTCPLLPRQPALHPRRLNPRNLRALAGADEVDHPDRQHLADGSSVSASTLACVPRKPSAARAESCFLIWLGSTTALQSSACLGDGSRLNPLLRHSSPAGVPPASRRRRGRLRLSVRSARGRWRVGQKSSAIFVPIKRRPIRNRCRIGRSCRSSLQTKSRHRQ